MPYLRKTEDRQERKVSSGRAAAAASYLDSGRKEVEAERQRLGG